MPKNLNTHPADKTYAVCEACIYTFLHFFFGITNKVKYLMQVHLIARQNNYPLTVHSYIARLDIVTLMLLHINTLSLVYC